LLATHTDWEIFWTFTQLSRVLLDRAAVIVATGLADALEIPRTVPPRTPSATPATTRLRRLDDIAISSFAEPGPRPTRSDRYTVLSCRYGIRIVVAVTLSGYSALEWP
jgi:hypothetical protein